MGLLGTQTIYHTKQFDLLRDWNLGEEAIFKEFPLLKCPLQMVLWGAFLLRNRLGVHSLLPFSRDARTCFIYTTRLLSYWDIAWIAVLVCFWDNHPKSLLRGLGNPGGSWKHLRQSVDVVYPLNPMQIKSGIPRQTTVQSGQQSREGKYLSRQFEKW